MPLFSKLDFVVGDGHGEMSLEKLTSDNRFCQKVKRMVPVFINGRRKKFSPIGRLALIKEEISKALNEGHKVMIDADKSTINIIILSG